MAKKKSEYCAYEDWSREDYRMAYEEADKLLKVAVAERNDLRDRVKELEVFQRSNQLWMTHSITLGQAIDRLLNDSKKDD